MFGHWETVTANWRSFVTMIFGSFVAGSTPQGGGAVAFPVFTKVFETPASVARTFSLSIQAIGMGSAALSILLSGKSVSKRAIAGGGTAAIVGFFLGLFVLADPMTAFWQSRIPESFVKVTFTVVLAALAYIVYLALDEGECGTWYLPVWNRRVWVGLGIAGLLGGVITSLIGSGADVFAFLFLVIVAGLHPRIAVPTSVIIMALVSVVGLVTLGLGHGQLSTEVVDGMVVAVGGSAIDPVPAARFDVWGLWISAVPAVIWGAPLGTMFVHSLNERHLISFLAIMAGIEVVSTAIFLPQLRSDPWLLTYALVGLAVSVLAVRWLHAHRDGLLGSAAPSKVDAMLRESVAARQAAERAAD
ncbi:MAG TPA: sulfite exporter TauE/SafE family protein [Acidimicrobiia bacterium]|jgi:uncharacterized membrane protein YfcA|nr:sulfite exporter TauE/SafE family protein [Acidimicrobiia bacterium]